MVCGRIVLRIYVAATLFKFLIKPLVSRKHIFIRKRILLCRVAMVRTLKNPLSADMRLKGYKRKIVVEITSPTHLTVTSQNYNTGSTET